MASTIEEPLLAAVGVRKRFGALAVLDGVDFRLHAGEAVGIVGPNGAGKTTLLNVLAGSLRPSEGSVRFRGADVSRSSSARRCSLGIGRAHQIPRPFGGMTVFENVFVGASTGGRQRGQAAYDRCIEVLERCDLVDVANRRAESLGLLHRKRLELARALATGPVVLLQVVERLVCMDAGRVIADGEPAAVMKDATVIDAYLGSSAR